MLNAIRVSLLVIALAPAIAIAAPAKKVKKTVTTTTETSIVPATAPVQEEAAPKRAADGQGTLFGSTGNGMAALKGLSVYAAFDFADQAEYSTGDKLATERAFDLGAVYEIPQFASGIAAQVGAEYDFSRAVKPTPLQAQNGVGANKFSQFVPFAELTVHLTPMFKLMGGINYNFPSLDNVPQGATFKGNVGYQFGGSIAFNDHIALDARYRSIQYDLTQDNTSTSIKENGFQAAGRFMF